MKKLTVLLVLMFISLNMFSQEDTGVTMNYMQRGIYNKSTEVFDYSLQHKKKTTFVFYEANDALNLSLDLHDGKPNVKLHNITL